MAKNLPDRMTVIEIAEPGGPEVLVPAKRAVPSAAAGEVLIKVEAAGVSRPDVLQRRGLYPPPPGASDLPGLEVAGTIAQLGPGVGAFKLGDRVVALLAGGGYAEYCVAPVPQVLPVPAGWSAVEAATLPENFFTVWTNLFERGRLVSGEWLLAHGGAGGIGSTAVMLGRAFGARVLATAGNAEKCAAVERLGAAAAFDHHQKDFVAEVMRVTEGRGVDVIVDVVGGDYVQRDLDALATEGRLVLLSSIGPPLATFNVLTVLMKRLTLTGSTLRARTPEQKGRIAASLKERVWPKLAAREIAPLVDSQFPLDQASKAHARLEEGLHIGKVVLTV